MSCQTQGASAKWLPECGPIANRQTCGTVSTILLHSLLGMPPCAGVWETGKTREGELSLLGQKGSQ
eukprot:9668561-Lingulodinium_polyedra.AAC.1